MSTTEYRARIINGEDDIEIVASDKSALSINQARSESIGFDIGPSTERCTAKAKIAWMQPRASHTPTASFSANQLS